MSNIICTIESIDDVIFELNVNNNHLEMENDESVNIIENSADFAINGNLAEKDQMESFSVNYKNYNVSNKSLEQICEILNHEYPALSFSIE